jgi:hypothetical protein
MNRQDVLRAWGRVLQGYQPLLSIELTRECPLRYPGHDGAAVAYTSGRG